MQTASTVLLLPASRASSRKAHGSWGAEAIGFSLVQDSSGAQRSWEVTRVNEMLACMESFDGIFIASTNLQDSLDKTSARRFDFKAKFGYLKPSHIRKLFGDLLAAFRLESSELEKGQAGKRATNMKRMGFV